MIERMIMLNSIEDVKNFVNIAISKDYDIDLNSGKYTVDAKSIMGIFSLDLTKPLKVTIHSDDESFFKEIEPYIYTKTK